MAELDNLCSEQKFIMAHNAPATLTVDPGHKGSNRPGSSSLEIGG